MIHSLESQSAPVLATMNSITKAILIHYSHTHQVMNYPLQIEYPFLSSDSSTNRVRN